MADRYQNRSFPAEHNYTGGSGSRAPANAESDPLAELARLIGQTDPLGTLGRANLQAQPRHRQPDPYESHERHDAQEYAREDTIPPPSPPAWMQRASRQEAPPQPQQDYPAAVHPLHRYASPNPAAAQDQEDYDQDYVDPDQEQDLSRYDDALYGEPHPDTQNELHHQAYAEDDYDYGDEPAESEAEPRHRRSMAVVFAVLALGVFGLGGAYAFRSYMGTARPGEPPIIRADATPTKVIPAPSEAGTKVPDRMVSGDSNEKIVPREEAPVDLSARSGPRVVFPPVNPNPGPPSTASVTPGPSPASGNGTLSNNEPRKIRTFPVRGDQADAAATPVAPPPTPSATAKPATRASTSARTASAANASASNSSTPLSLAPQSAPPIAEPPIQTAAATPTQNVPPAQNAATPAAAAAGGYLVQVSSQRSESDAQASYKALQGKFPSVLGSRSPLIKRADLGEKGVYYRAMVGPFGSSEEASQFCGSLKSAGGQCVIQRN
jgi:hypothetical protein